MDMIENEARRRGADDVGDGIRRKKQRDRMTQLALSKPVRQIQEDSRKIPSLRDAKEKPRHIQVHCGLHKAGENRHESPADQYSRNPDTRAEPVEQQVARYLEQDVPWEKHRGDEAVLLAVNAE